MKRASSFEQDYMQDKLSEKELIRLVEEVSKLDLERKQMLDKSQVSQILKEMDLSDDLLDEAMVRLDEKRAVEKKKRIVFSVTAAVAAVAIIALSSTLWMSSNYAGQLAKVTAADTRITTEVQSSADLSVVTAGNGTIFAQVTLHDVPLGTRLPMRVEWIDPSGTVFRENTWQTKPTDKQTWQTHAKVDLPTSVAKGDWVAKFLLGDRIVATKTFVVN